MIMKMLNSFVIQKEVKVYPVDWKFVGNTGSIFVAVIRIVEEKNIINHHHFSTLGQMLKQVQRHGKL